MATDRAPGECRILPFAVRQICAPPTLDSGQLLAFKYRSIPGPELVTVQDANTEGNRTMF